MRFPFTLMGLVAVGAGVWTIAYISALRHLDTFSFTIAAMSGLLLLGLGAYLLYRRLRHGPQG